MGDVELPPDPYLALGVSKDADAAAIKTAYRKLVLKCHPDKVPDPAAKQAAADRFHIIQTSYERLIDDKARARYDAEVKLAELRKERLSQRGPEPRATRSYPSSHETPRPSPQDYRSSAKVAPTYEERRPAYAEQTEVPPRSTRKEPEYERPSRRAAHDVKEKAQARASMREVKETERADRREKAKKTTKDTRRDRDSKYRPTYNNEVSTSDDTDSDANARASRRATGDREARRREDERRAQEYLHEQIRPSRQEPADEYFFGDRARKLFAQHESARDYMNKAARGRQNSDARPPPTRSGSSRDPIHEYGPKGESRPAYISRRTSTREPPSRREPDSIPRSMPRERDRDRYSSSEEAPRTRPTTLNQSRSSPNDIHIPSDKPRAQSLQHDADPFDPPRVRRAETMPLNQTRGRPEKSYRATEFHEGLATPGATPEYGVPPSQPKYRYPGNYADDYPAPETSRPSEPYYTEVREPAREGRRTETRDAHPEYSRGMARSPSPVKEVREPRRVREARDLRTNSSRYMERPGPVPLNTRTTSYKYDERSGGVETLPTRSRPTSARESSYRGPPPSGGRLYGEIPQQPSTRPRSPQRGSGEERYQRSFRPEDMKFESGYQTKTTSPDRPPVGRSGSNIVYAR